MSFPEIEKQFCKEVTSKFIAHPLCRAFLRPVDPELDGALDYLDVISNPMDLGTVNRKLETGQYRTAREWYNDLMLIWTNSMTYNKKKPNLLHSAAEHMKHKCEKMFKRIPTTEADIWLLKMNKLHRKLDNFLAINVPEENYVPRDPKFAIHD